MLIPPITHSRLILPIVVPIVDKHDEDGNLILDGNVLLGNIACVSKVRLGDLVTVLKSDENERSG